MPLTAEGFKPSKFIIIQRLIAKFIIAIFRINGSTRWGNEFIQSIDQTVNIENPLNISKKLKLTTGHGFQPNVNPFSNTTSQIWLWNRPSIEQLMSHFANLCQ